MRLLFALLLIAATTQAQWQSTTPVIAGAVLGDPVIHKASQWDTTTHPSFYLATFTTNSSCSPDELQSRLCRERKK
jgi:hypothetical protein